MVAYPSLQLRSAVFTQDLVLWTEEPDDFSNPQWWKEHYTRRLHSSVKSHSITGREVNVISYFYSLQSFSDKNKNSVLPFWSRHDRSTLISKIDNWKDSLDKSTRFLLEFGAWVHFVPSLTSCSLWRPIWQKYYWLFHLDTNKKINATKHCSHKQNQWHQTLHCLTYVTNNNKPKPESLIWQYTAH